MKKILTILLVFVYISCKQNTSDTKFEKMLIGYWEMVGCDGGGIQFEVDEGNIKQYGIYLENTGHPGGMGPWDVTNEILFLGEAYNDNTMKYKIKFLNSKELFISNIGRGDYCVTQIWKKLD